MENRARNAEGAYKDARALMEKVQSRPKSAANDALLKQLEEIAPEESRGGGGGRGGRGGGRGGAAAAPEVPPNLATIGARLVASVQGMQASEMPPTAVELKSASTEQAAYTSLMAKWAALKARAGGSAAPAKAAAQF